MSINTINSMEECQRVCTQSPDKLIVLDFSAVWCGPCKTIYPKLQELSVLYQDKAEFYKIDIDKLPNVANHFGIDSVPTFKFARNNKIVAEFSGADAARLKKTLAELLD